MHVDSAGKEENGIRMLTGNKLPFVEKQERIFTAMLHRQFSSGVGLKIDKNTTPSPKLYLLREYKEPSVVLELGNLNNDADRALLLTSEGRDAIAENIMAAVIAYSKQTREK